MSLKVSGLTKIYGKQKALDQISFEAKEGEIVGLLGPNGAGKSTAMKIITCYLPPSAGEVEVYGYDIYNHPLEIKRTIGYLPEHNPMYLDMYVHEYLAFVGSLYQMNRKKIKQRVQDVVFLCGLTLEQNKKIETLSKGYRQRVGLAQALLHDPKALILDEPTTGLDPNQIIEIRNLIKAISKEKTVIFSSHIMQEVEALCDRVVIIDRGKIVANGSVADLQKGASKHNAVSLEFSVSIDTLLLKSIDNVVEVIETAPGKYTLMVDTEVDVRPALFRLAAEHNLPLLGLKLEENTMESVFQQLTQVKNI
jgi:ABC-2 type transport system ATP-binding protein